MKQQDEIKQFIPKRVSYHHSFKGYMKQFLPISNKENVFIITNKRKIEDKTFYWLKNTKNNKYFNKRFQRQELFAILNNFK